MTVSIPPIKTVALPINAYSIIMTVVFTIGHFILFFKFLNIWALNLIHTTTIIDLYWESFFFATFSAIDFISLSIKFDHIVIYLKSQTNSQFQIFRKNTSRLSSIGFYLKIVLLCFRAWISTIRSILFFKFYSFVTLGLVILLSIALYFSKIIIRTSIFIISIFKRRAKERMLSRDFSSRTLIDSLFSSLIQKRLLNQRIIHNILFTREINEFQSIFGNFLVNLFFLCHNIVSQKNIIPMTEVINENIEILSIVLLHFVYFIQSGISCSFMHFFGFEKIVIMILERNYMQ